MTITTCEEYAATPKFHCRREHSSLSEARALLERLTDRLGQLPQPSQTLVKLHFCHGMEIDQIAKALDIPTSDIHALWREALHHVCSSDLQYQERCHG